jgi:nicotinamidase-related amidase
MSDLQHESLFPSPDASALLVVDVQERLIAAMPEAPAAALVKAHLALIEMADIFELPITYTEQYPRGLGPTVESIRGLLDAGRRVEKLEFSVCQNEGFCTTALPDLPRDVILTGMETHVCVLQTAVDLIDGGHRVFVPLDAVLSRTDANYRNGLALMEHAGAVITNSETIIFERLGSARGDAFKRLSKAVK